MGGAKHKTSRVQSSRGSSESADPVSPIGSSPFLSCCLATCKSAISTESYMSFTEALVHIHTRRPGLGTTLFPQRSPSSPEGNFQSDPIGDYNYLFPRGVYWVTKTNYSPSRAEEAWLLICGYSHVPVFDFTQDECLLSGSKINLIA